MSLEFDPKDIHDVLRRHGRLKLWLQEAIKFIESHDGIVAFQNDDYMRTDWGFAIDVPAETWKPQLEWRILEAKEKLNKLEIAGRAYFEAGK